MRDGAEVVAEIPAVLLTDECPVYVREGQESQRVVALRAFDLDSLPDLGQGAVPDASAALVRLLASPNIASREPIYRTYDHTIMTNTVESPGAGDAAIVRVKGTPAGLAVKTDCNPRYVYLDPFTGGAHAVAEAARNVSCVGAEPLAITNCLNFGNPEKSEVYFQLEQAIRGMAEACRVLGTPVVSGNVSLYNESGSEPILPTPTVGMVGLLEDVARHVGQGFVPGGEVYLVGSDDVSLGGSEYLATIHGRIAGTPPKLDLDFEARVQAAVRAAIREGLAAAAHDTSEGGLAVALAESCLVGGVGGTFDVPAGGRLDRALFGEAASRVLLQARPGAAEALEAQLRAAGVPFRQLGQASGNRFTLGEAIDLPLATVGAAWRSALL